MNFSHVPGLFWKLVIKQTTMQSFFMELTEEEWREVEDQTHTHIHTHSHSCFILAQTVVSFSVWANLAQGTVSYCLAQQLLVLGTLNPVAGIRQGSGV